jgi:hypothetical protein
VFWRTLGILMALHACATFNQFESVQHQFPTSQPWMSTAAQTVAQQMFQAFSRSLLAAFQFSLAITLKPQRTDKTKGQPDGNGGPLVKFGPGIVIGLGLIAAHYGLIGMWQRERPVWPGLVDANAAWPPVAVLPLHVTLRFLHDVPLALLAMTAATLLFPDSGDVYAAPPAMSKLSLYFIPARLIVAAPAMLSTVTWGALLPWTAAQMVTGLGMSAAFRLVYRHDLSQLPIAYALGTHSAHTSLKCTARNTTATHYLLAAKRLTTLLACVFALCCGLVRCWPTAVAVQVIGEWMLREHQDSAPVVSALLSLAYAATTVQFMLT